MDKQFQVKFVGAGTWFPLYSSTEDLNNKTPLLSAKGDLVSAFEDMDEGIAVFDLKTAKREAQKQFFDKDTETREARKWIVSNGEIAFIRGAKKPFEVSEDIFGKAKEAMPACTDSVVARSADGSFTRKTVARIRHNFNGGSRHDMRSRAAEEYSKMSKRRLFLLV